MNEDQPELFHSVDESETKSQGPIKEHFQKHYKKHLFWLWILLGVGIFKLASIVFTFFGISTETDKLKADYMPTPTEQYLQTFDQLDAIVHQKDKFFHQKGKIYSMTGATVFQKTDNVFHIVDNEYHQTTDIQQKFIKAQELIKVINQQEELFQSTRDINTDRDISFSTLNDLLQQLATQVMNK